MVPIAPPAVAIDVILKTLLVMPPSSYDFRPQVTESANPSTLNIAGDIGHVDGTAEIVPIAQDIPVRAAQ